MHMSKEKIPHCVIYRKSPNFLVWKFCGNAQFLKKLQNFHARKLGKVTVIYAVPVSSCVQQTKQRKFKKLRINILF